MTGALATLEARLDRIGRGLLSWWVWPAALVAAGLAALLGAWAFVPSSGEHVAFLGGAAFPPCPSLVETGLPCGQCGMTRSWVWAARGRLGLAFAYNPAGLALWLWLIGGALVGGLRLWRRDAGFARWRPAAVGIAAVAWLGLYGAAYALRLQGYNPLP